jgi:hypothetical protein
MDLSWITLAAFAIFLTPSFGMLLVFRYYIPRGKSIPSNDLIFLLFFSLIATIINFSLLLYYGKQFWVANASRFDPNIFNFIFGKLDLSPIRPIAYIFNNNETNIVNFFLDIHIRPMIVGIFIFGAFKKLEEIDEYINLRLFEGTFHEMNMFAIFFVTVAYKLDNDRGTYRRKIKNKGWFPDFIKNYQRIFYHPWKMITENNNRLEILLVDVFCSDGNLYSGILTDWLPAHDEIASLNLDNVLRYYPDVPQQNAMPIKKDGVEVVNGSQSDMKKSLRKWRLVKNKGELVLPYKNILTIHLYRIRKGANIKIAVDDENSLETLKWYLMLLHNNPNVFEVIEVDVIKKDAEYENFENKLSEWIGINSLILPPKKVKLSQVS